MKRTEPSPNKKFTPLEWKLAVASASKTSGLLCIKTARADNSKVGENLFFRGLLMPASPISRVLQHLRKTVVLARATDGHQAGAEILLLDAVSANTRKQFHAVDLPKKEVGPGRPTSSVEAIAMSPDSKSVLSAGSDAAVCVWDAITGAQLLRFLGHEGSVHTVAFGAGGRTALSCGEDGQVYIWDLRPPQAREKRSLDELWSRLADVNAYAAVWEFAESNEAPDFLRAKIAPRERVPQDFFTKVLGALDSQNFQQREEANKALRALDDRTIGPLTEALRKPPSLEAQRRMESLLKALQGEPTGSQLRQLRAIQALELAASKRAREVLRDWSQGAPGARLTVDAQAALARLESRGR